MVWDCHHGMRGDAGGGSFDVLKSIRVAGLSFRTSCHSCNLAIPRTSLSLLYCVFSSVREVTETDVFPRFLTPICKKGKKV